MSSDLHGLTAKPCAYCGRAIVWVRTAASGSWMPLDIEPDKTGNVILEGHGRDARAHVLGRKSLFDRDAWSVGAVRRQSHFNTCPKADEARRRKSKPRPGASP